jgi:hypothetical protein
MVAQKGCLIGGAILFIKKYILILNKFIKSIKLKQDQLTLFIIILQAQRQ